MDLVNGYGRLKPVSLLPRPHPLIIRPAVLIQVPYHGRALRPELGIEGKGVGLLREKSLISRFHLELVSGPLLGTGDEEFPGTRRAPHAHHVPSSVPIVEITDNAYAESVRRP